MTGFSYDSDLVGGSLMVRESRILADIMLSGADQQRWDQIVLVDNRLQKRTTATAKRLAQTIRKRLECVDSEFLQVLRDGDENLATQAAFYAALERNLLLVGFMERVVADAYLTHSEQLQFYQWYDFLDECAERDSTIYKWTDSSKRKMGQVAMRMLTEMGYLKDTRSLQLQNVLIRPEIRLMLEEQRKHRLLNCMDVRFRGAQFSATT